MTASRPLALRRHTWRDGLPLLISATLLVLLLKQVDSWTPLRDLDRSILGLALSCALLLDSGLGACKWWWILRRLGEPISLRVVWRVWTGLLPLTFFAPFQSGHALYPLALSRATGIDLVVATESVLYDKALTLVSTLALIAVGQGLLPAGHPLAQAWIAPLALVGVSLWFLDRPVLIWLARRRDRLPRRLALLLARSALLRQAERAHPLAIRDKIGLLLTGMVYQSSDSLSVWLGAMALGLDLPMTLAFGAFPLALLVSYAPLTVAGLGLREPAAALALSGALSWDEGLLAGILVDGLEYLAPAVFGVICLPWLVDAVGLSRRQRP